MKDLASGQDMPPEFWDTLRATLAAEYTPEVQLARARELATQLNLTISFQGTYSQVRGQEIQTIPFVMVHNRLQAELMGSEMGSLEGFILEPRHIAQVKDGAFWKDAICFDKLYLKSADGQRFNPHKLHYNGTSLDGSLYCGTWRFETKKAIEMPNCGSFNLSRVR